MNASMSISRIDHYRFGRIVIDGLPYSKDVVIFPDHVVSPWWRRKGHELQPEDIVDILDAKPAVLVVGQGAYGMLQVLAEARDALDAVGIEVQAYPTERACAVYNELCQMQVVIAALHLTC